MNKKIFKLTMVFLIFSTVVLTGAVAQTTGQTTSRRGANLQLILIGTEPVPLMKGEYADVRVKLRNTGYSKAKNVELEYVPEYPFSIDPDRDKTKYFGDIEQGEEYHARFQVRVDDNAVSGEHDLKFRTSTEVATRSHNVPVDVRTREAVISVEEVSVEDDLIPPSMTKEVSLEISNLADSTMRNIDISLGLRPEAGSPEEAQFGMEGMDTGEEIPLITVGETTEKRISSIAPKETSKVTFPVKADSDADEKAYKVPIGLRYEDEMGNEFQKLEYTGITVGGIPELETGIASIDEYPVSGEVRDVSIRMINRGLSKAKFVKMEVLEHESFEVIGERDEYIGEMEPDDYDSSSFKIYIEEGVEEVEIPLSLEYRDSEGNVMEEEQTVSFGTYDREYLESIGLIEDGRGVLTALLIVIAIVVLVIIYRKKKNRRKSLLEEE